MKTDVDRWLDEDLNVLYLFDLERGLDMSQLANITVLIDGSTLAVSALVRLSTLISLSENLRSSSV